MNFTCRYTDLISKCTEKTNKADLAQTLSRASDARLAVKQKREPKMN